MLSAADNERITRTGPGTPMGQALRRYWIPALLSSEVPVNDCDPVRVSLLGERLVAFRDTRGRVGLIAENCPHRGASLFFGRNAEGGLRCVYHGWKFAIEGSCLDTPNQVAATEQVNAVAYPCVEMAGVVWAWMGPPEGRPPLQTQEWMRVADENRDVCRHLGDCNWLQLLEGGIDTSHSSFLHRTFNRDSQATTLTFRARATAPRLEVVRTEYGYSYAGIRHLPEQNQNYVRVYQFVMPFHQMRAFEGYLGHRLVSGHIWVPVDDEHTWVWSWSFTTDGERLPSEVAEVERRQAGRTSDDVVPGTVRFKRNRANDYLIDRRRQKSVNYTGVETIAAQDQAIQESMGPIASRSTEHLGTSDLAIIAARRLLLEACDDVAHGKPPLGSEVERVGARPAEMLLPADQSWLETMREQLVAPI
ncbi:MAG TPA: Rieske 2Fe-2S domain-containing protein [Chloroflexota bacterium]